MRCRMTDLRYKEVINIIDGSRYGYVGDAELDLVSGRICALIVPGPARLFGLLGRFEEYVFSWECIKRIGEDTILVECQNHQPSRPPRERRKWF